MNIYYTNLFDYYASLFTIKQQQYFKDYYFENLTLQEIAENNNVSRANVHNIIKEVIAKLDYYEENLNLYKNGKKIKTLIKNIDEKLREEIEELI